MSLPCCEYCHETDGLVTCECGRHFCNGKVSNMSDCQILTHLKMKQHFSVSVGGKKLICKKCNEETNVFNLRYRTGENAFICQHCLEQENEVTQTIYSNCVVQEGSFTTNNLDVGDSFRIISKDCINVIENQIDTSDDEVLIKDQYNDISEYCEIYQKVSGFEYDKPNELEECMYYTKEGIVTFEVMQNLLNIHLIQKKAIGGLVNGDTCILTCGGNKGLLNEYNLYNIQRSSLYKETKGAFMCNVINISSKTIVLRFKNIIFPKQDDEIQIQEEEQTNIISEQTIQTVKDIIQRTKLVRGFFLLNSKGSPFTRSLKCFEEREEDEYYATILGKDVQTSRYKTNDEYSPSGEINEKKLSCFNAKFNLINVNPPELVNPCPLNESQKLAVVNALNNSVSLIIGPPGTGKTSVAVSIVQHLKLYKRIFTSYLDSPILVTGSSNNAVDVLCLKLIDAGLSVVRVISDEKMTEIPDKLRESSLLKRALDYSIKSGVTGYIIEKRRRITAQEILSEQVCDEDIVEAKKRGGYVTNEEEVECQSIMLKKYNSYLTTSELKTYENTQRQYLNYREKQKNLRYPLSFEDYVKKYNDRAYTLLKRISTPISKEDIDKINQYINQNMENIFKEVDCVCSTLTLCTRKIILNQHFVASIIDEAAQSLEPETLAGVMNVRKAILIGDIQQLEPCVTSPKAKALGFDKTMFERLLASESVPRTLLNTQYRMHPFLSTFSNKVFYSSRLIDGVTAMDRSDPNVVPFIFKNVKTPLMFINCDGSEYIGNSGSSFGNVSESKIVNKLVQGLKEKNVADDRIGIISPYTTQRDLLSTISSTIKVASVDGFQGNEKDYIIFSTVRSNKEIGIGFVSDYRRLNVSLTRARLGMYIVGNVETLAHNRVWGMLFNYLNKNNCIFKNENNTLVQYTPSCVSKETIYNSPFQITYRVDNGDEDDFNGNDEITPLLLKPEEGKFSTKKQFIYSHKERMKEKKQEDKRVNLKAKITVEIPQIPHKAQIPKIDFVPQEVVKPKIILFKL
ncbi:hypothetical protein EIN_084130, partial [Entamoeba invadens IP1]|uniref:hypothetical protein n=1 Tax=Entamoeba invadens IP1 TaxID=370355 RepID=UPI0002C3F0DD